MISLVFFELYLGGILIKNSRLNSINVNIDKFSFDRLALDKFGILRGVSGQNIFQWAKKSLEAVSVDRVELKFALGYYCCSSWLFFEQSKFSKVVVRFVFIDD